MSRFKEPGFWAGVGIILAFTAGFALASDPRRNPPKPAPWMQVNSTWAEDGQQNFYNPVIVYAQCDGATRVFVAVMARSKYSDGASGGGVSITAVPGGCERTKAEEPK